MYYNIAEHSMLSTHFCPMTGKILQSMIHFQNLNLINDFYETPRTMKLKFEIRNFDRAFQMCKHPFNNVAYYYVVVDTGINLFKSCSFIAKSILCCIIFAPWNVRKIQFWDSCYNMKYISATKYRNIDYYMNHSHFTDWKSIHFQKFLIISLKWKMRNNNVWKYMHTWSNEHCFKYLTVLSIHDFIARLEMR